jgi:two-component system, OmpR family, response regulator
MSMASAIRLLLVDDEENFVNTLSRLLSAKGLEVTACLGGRQALDLFAPGKFDVALVDVKMPGISGVDLLSRLKELDPDLDVIILTGHASVDIASDIMCRGGCDYLLKPCPTNEILAKIYSALERRKTRGT